MDVRKRQRKGAPILDLLGVLIERGKKAGKQVIRSTGLSIVVGVDGTWHECTTPYHILRSRLCPLDLSLDYAPCVCVQKNAVVVSGTAALLPLLSLPMLLLLPPATITSQFAASKLKHRPIFPTSSVSSRFTSLVHLFPCPRDHLTVFNVIFHTQSRPLFHFPHCPFLSSSYGIYAREKTKYPNRTLIIKLFSFSFSLTT